MEYIQSVAITGGPSTEKSTLMKAASKQMPEAYFVPEVATITRGLNIINSLTNSK